MNRNELVENLRFGIVTVVFKKVNGDLREMTCTLSRDVVPPTPPSNDKKPNKDIIPVWDTDKKAWRSFRLENIISILVGGEERAYTG